MATDLGFCMALGTENTRSDDDERRVCSSEEAPVQLDLLPFSPVPRAHHLPWLTHQKLMPDRGSSDGITTTTGRSALPAVEEGDDGAAVSSPNSTTVSSFQMDFPARNRNNNNNNHKRDMDQLGLSDEDDNALTRKKLRLSKDQSAFLEQSFTEHTTLNPKQKLALAKQLNLRPRQVEVVPEQKSKDKAEADGGGLRVLKKMLRETVGREQKVAQGTARIKSFEDLSAFLQPASGHHSHHVSLLRACSHHHHHHLLRHRHRINHRHYKQKLFFIVSCSLANRQTKTDVSIIFSRSTTTPGSSPLG